MRWKCVTSCIAKGKLKCPFPMLRFTFLYLKLFMHLYVLCFDRSREALDQGANYGGVWPHLPLKTGQRKRCGSQSFVKCKCTCFSSAFSNNVSVANKVILQVSPSVLNGSLANIIWGNHSNRCLLARIKHTVIIYHLNNSYNGLGRFLWLWNYLPLTVCELVKEFKRNQLFFLFQKISVTLGHNRLRLFWRP